ncbi:MAG: calcium/sodium antiporter [Defluviitaleaceae bacterium]|nr:calcium/sodium antiporter [Defluviitaleaceae bacterium]MCL2261841.1 calcium/sodium antiporter [Defluviitaleaceae bacterium]
MILNSFLLILGFALLIKGSDIFVDASVGIAEKLSVPKVIIGLTIVAMGTSAPELVISVTASARGSNALAIGNIVGSNIFNLMLIIGLCAVIRPMIVNVRQIHKDFWISIAAAIMLLVLKVVGGDFIPRAGSLLLVAIFATYMFFLIRKAIKTAEPHEHDEQEKKSRPLPIYALIAIFGLGLIIGGGHLTVESASYIAAAMNISERIIGLTVIAIGTSLPELVISLVACKKGENEFALGNIIGSNIFNILFILGVAGLVSPLQIDGGLVADTSFLIVGSLLTIAFVYSRKRISRPEGALMVLMYLAYMVFTVFAATAPIVV